MADLEADANPGQGLLGAVRDEMARYISNMMAESFLKAFTKDALSPEADAFTGLA